MRRNARPGHRRVNVPVPVAVTIEWIPGHANAGCRPHPRVRAARHIGLEPFVAELVAHPQLNAALSEETEARLPSVAGARRRAGPQLRRSSTRRLRTRRAST